MHTLQVHYVCLLVSRYFSKNSKYYKLDIIIRGDWEEHGWWDREVGVAWWVTMHLFRPRDSHRLYITLLEK